MKDGFFAKELETSGGLPGTVNKDRKYYEAFLYYLNFNACRPFSEDKSVSFFLYKLETGRFDPLTDTENLLTHLKSEYFHLFEKLDEELLLERIKSLKTGKHNTSEDLIELIRSIVYVNWLNFQSLFVFFYEEINRIISEDERRCGHLLDRPFFDEFERALQSITPIEDQAIEEAISKILSGTSVTNNANPVENYYFQEHWPFAYSEIKRNFLNAKKSFHADTYPILRSTEKSLGRNFENAAPIWEDAFESLSGGILGKLDLKRLPDTLAGNAKKDRYVWYINGKLMSNYFLDFLTKTASLNHTDKTRKAQGEPPRDKKKRTTFESIKDSLLTPFFATAKPNPDDLSDDPLFEDISAGELLEEIMVNESDRFTQLELNLYWNGLKQGGKISEIQKVFINPDSKKPYSRAQVDNAFHSLVKKIKQILKIE